MNKRRKSADILSQLGEPLPLPYQAEPSRVKKEGLREDVLPSRTTSADYGLRSRLHSGSDHMRANSIPDPYPHELSTEDRVPLPIWRKASGATRKRDINISDYSIEATNDGFNENNEVRTFGEHDAIIRSLHQKLDDLGQEYGSHTNSRTFLRQNLKTLEHIGDELDELLQESQQKHILNEQQHIIHELEKYQRLSTPSRPGQLLRWYVALGILSILMLLMSFFAGHFSYEYCYYMC